MELYYYGKTILGLCAIAVFGYMYLQNPEYLNFASKDHWIGVDIFWFILVIDFVWRFIPSKFHHPGQQKYLKRSFQASSDYAATGIFTKKEQANKRTADKGALIALGLFYAMNAVWLVLYLLEVFRPQELFGLMLLYYIGDMICVLGFCPFRLLFMRNRCCNVCRIYNWDAIMLVTPLLLVPGLYSWTLGLIAIAYTIVWEVSYYRHPERFFDSSNVSLSCKHCKHGLCPYRYKKNQKKKEKAEAS